jgi:hypothetical protein
MTASTGGRARHDDGTFTPEFLRWEAELAFRVTAREFTNACRHLRIVLGIYGQTTATTDHVIGVAMIRAVKSTNIAARLDAVHAAQQNLMDAVWALAEVDPDFDVRPFLPPTGPVA